MSEINFELWTVVLVKLLSSRIRFAVPLLGTLLHNLRLYFLRIDVVIR